MKKFIAPALAVAVVGTAAAFAMANMPTKDPIINETPVVSNQVDANHSGGDCSSCPKSKGQTVEAL
jgi:hypothetical protein